MKRGPKSFSIEKFWAKIIEEPNTGCWVWLGARWKNGYGKLAADSSGKQRLAHRWAYEYFKGVIQTGLTIDHLCRNRACVNPAHLEAVTHRENCVRGMGWSGINARKTHCPQGHELVAGNLREGRGGRGGCLTCYRSQTREAAKRQRQRVKEA